MPNPPVELKKCYMCKVAHPEPSDSRTCLFYQIGRHMKLATEKDTEISALTARVGVLEERIERALALVSKEGCDCLTDYCTSNCFPAKVEAAIAEGGGD